MYVGYWVGVHVTEWRLNATLLVPRCIQHRKALIHPLATTTTCQSRVHVKDDMCRDVGTLSLPPLTVPPHLNAPQYAAAITPCLCSSLNSSAERQALVAENEGCTFYKQALTAQRANAKLLIIAYNNSQLNSLVGKDSTVDDFVNGGDLFSLDITG